MLFYITHDKYEFLIIISQVMSAQFSWQRGIMITFWLPLFHAEVPELKQIQNNSPQQWFIQRKSPYKSQTSWQAILPYVLLAAVWAARERKVRTPTEY